ncbi:MAG TPA: bifunctional indole-3-glycerol-phosphate synthase TrpC/phosphoribosylanthranilate isomerase TrpF [bacterium]|nr:bifunctional indole-3-glycerol-phosphate synthase TrpC/phosphoribosylanthranilate isomerase TrpF [bacterium]
MILDKIITNKKREIENHKQNLSLDAILSQLTPSTKNFKTALQEGSGINLIAEVKRKSPSRGLIRPDLDIKQIIKLYDQNPNINAISFLTDEKYFGGNLDGLQQITSRTKKAILRKDFIIDEYQIYESRFFGADAVLLIARILSKIQIEKYIDLARKYNMDCLVEIHNKEDIKKLPENAEIIGINNRNLATMEINLNSTRQLSQKIAKEKVLVTESGILNSEDVQNVKKFADAMLVGSAIMASSDPSAKIDALLRPKIKICGLTNFSDANLCASLGADFLGFIFYEKSPRFVDPQKASTIIKKIKNQYPEINAVGVFVNADIGKVRKTRNECELDYLQLHGDESPQYVKQLEGNVIKAFRVENKSELRASIEQYENEFVLLDTFHPDKYGGTGESFDWNVLQKLPDKKIFLAGGINPDNFSLAISYQPYAIDINSGVEMSPGKKDKNLLQKIVSDKLE